MKQKRFSFHLWAISLLLLTACAPTPTPAVTATQAPEQEPVSTQTESPGLSPEPTELSGPSYTNPVYKFDFPDPHVILVGDTYYAYATAAYGTESGIQVITSTDLANWENLGDALPILPE